MPRIGKKLSAHINKEVCGFPKHKGKRWDEIVHEDREYMEWLISLEGPPMNDDLYEHIVFVLEENLD